MIGMCYLEWVQGTMQAFEKNPIRYLPTTEQESTKRNIHMKLSNTNGWLREKNFKLTKRHPAKKRQETSWNLLEDMHRI